MGSTPAPDALPDDVATLQALLAEREAEHKNLQNERDRYRAQLSELHDTVAQLERTNAGLEHRLDLVLRRLYGRLSEKVDASQLLLFGDSMRRAAESAEKITEKNADDTHAKRPGQRRGRRALPADLPRHRIEHAVDTEALSCPCCGEARTRIGEDITEQLDYVPASLFVIQHVRPKLACRSCEEGGVARADKPAGVIEKGLPGPGLVAHVITSKYADHAPLYRLERMLARHGVDIARSTMCGWMRAAADLLAPLVRRMEEHVRSSRVIHTDDTPVPVQEKGRGRTKAGRLWVYLGDPEHPYTVFDYTPTRSRDGPMRWLEQYEGYLQADAFGGYDGIFASGNGRRVIEVACWAHARRKFYDARKTDAARAHHALGEIRRLYAIEREAAELGRVERQMRRRERALPVLDGLRRWLEDERDAVLPKSPMGVAIGYALSNWEALVRYAREGDGRLSIDNNAAERAIRPVTIGRKNYLFFGSDVGGRTGAALYSVVASARRHGLDPFAYLREVLATIGDTPVSRLDALLPDRWRDEQLQSIAER